MLYRTSKKLMSKHFSLLRMKLHNTCNIVLILCVVSTVYIMLLVYSFNLINGCIMLLPVVMFSHISIIFVLLQILLLFTCIYNFLFNNTIPLILAWCNLSYCNLIMINILIFFCFRLFSVYEKCLLFTYLWQKVGSVYWYTGTLYYWFFFTINYKSFVYKKKYLSGHRCLLQLSHKHIIYSKSCSVDWYCKFF